ncbi:hypothetical protein Sgly_0347 [Syntrophobotulus glycolicus DSM 8271]|uniref:DUF6673 domain-containing protein n=1 Tax=Syntrophobotulus glycolicus (strain DSM 8271 / FlGlyR) TaxID=645991 RepID=F0SXG7_SYNGF|nr:DUF6673 family protein [Syntrophobotulus glycolicus]ADY54713.1 hypothetical protein Sgly_0347 [Syntrophobotulus glycolicus DSM 8271]
MKLTTGRIEIPIERDGENVGSLAFNPNDMAFVDRFYGLIGDFEAKEKEYQEKALALEENTETDSYGIPKNMKERLALLKDICGFLRGRIDYVFGDGVSQKVFGDANTLDMFEQFFDGIAPFIQQARVGKVEKYTGNRAQRRAAKVMK